MIDNMLDHWYDWYRLVNSALAVVVLIRLLRFARLNWNGLSDSKKDQWWIWSVVSACCAVISFDSALRASEFTARTILVTLICIVLLKGVYLDHLWEIKESDDEDLQ